MRVDKLGRRTRANSRPDDIDLEIIPRPPEREMLRFINQHGKANTNYLHASCSYSHLKNTQEGILRLWQGGYIFRPKQQRSGTDRLTAISVYELDDRGRSFLQMKDCYLPPNGTASWWVHDYLSAIVTSSIQLAATEAGWEFVGRDRIYNIKDPDPRYPKINGATLRFDDLFALRNPADGKWDACVLEIDRGNEPITSTKARKNYEDTILRYQEYIGSKVYKDHLGLNTRLLNLNVFTSKHREKAYQELIKKHIGDCSYMMTTVVPDFDDYDWKSPKEVWTHLFNGEWNRVGHKPFSLSL